ncbi:uncharacterized protein LOC132186615 [Corylus avellana]|uniref:uncharacterized protein LOC132186615 n=1 Tax=Corylus avellana TaxID=13451 RepID=UPI00286D420D|nr:uncharacterized protein LOC132186615 [Corylus avellana]
MYLLQSGFGNYGVLLNNCEDFALYCKTGLRVVGGRNRTETGNTGVGGSGQTSSFVGVPLAAIVSSTLKWLVPIAVRMATAAVGYAGMYCMTRYANDIGVREDVMKVAVEDLAENMGWEGNEAYFVQMNSVLVPILDGTNFTEWSQQVRFHLGFLDLDLALRINKPHAITKSSNAKERVMYKSWERSNRLSIMFMRNTIESKLTQFFLNMTMLGSSSKL